MVKNSNQLSADEIISKLELIPLEGEGGFYKRTWVSDLLLNDKNVVSVYGEEKPAGSAIYFLLKNTEDGFSALHSLPSPEVYHFYLGDPVELSLFKPDGSVEQVILGTNILSGENLQYTVPSSVIQGSRVASGGEWSLLGTTMSPGFTQKDFRLSSRNELIKKYPASSDLIISLTREEDL